MVANNNLRFLRSHWFASYLLPLKSYLVTYNFKSSHFSAPYFWKDTWEAKQPRSMYFLCVAFFSDCYIHCAHWMSKRASLDWRLASLFPLQKYSASLLERKRPSTRCFGQPVIPFLTGDGKMMLSSNALEEAGSTWNEKNISVSCSSYRSHCIYMQAHRTFWCHPHGQKKISLAFSVSGGPSNLSSSILDLDFHCQLPPAWTVPSPRATFRFEVYGGGSATVFRSSHG